MVQVKICGLKTPEIAVQCAKLGADAIGLVFFPKSPRHINDDAARSICEALPTWVQKVGVFVDESENFVLKKVRYCGLTAVQLHGQETPEIVQRLRDQGLIVIKGLFASRPPFLDAAPNYDPDGFLVECGKGVLPGGNAAVWDWASVKNFGRQHPMILAGGLSPENLAKAITTAEPDAVDVSSGVESAPGIKDLEKAKAFIATAKESFLNRETRTIF